MLRAAFFAMLLCLSFEMSGLTAMFEEDLCDCSAEDSGGTCPPNCQACSCCSLPKTIPPTQVDSVTARVATTAHWSTKVAAPASADGREILHVPKFCLA